MKKNSIILIPAIVLVAALGIGAYVMFGTGDDTATGVSVSEPSGADGETLISAVPATPGSISVTVEGPSVVEPYRSQEIRSRIPGTIVESVEEGGSVEQGSVLARFDDTDQVNARRQAELNLQQARVDLQRAELALQSARSDLEDKESLFTSGTITRDQRDTAREAAANAELSVNSARIKVSQNELSLETATEALQATVVRAPFTGVVLSSNVSTGDVVSSGSVLMTFADLTRIRLRAEVDEFDIGKVREGMPVTITADSLGKDSLQSTVERVSPAAEVVNNISIFIVSTVLRSTEGGLRPGMSADLSILISDDTGLVVPSNAVSTVRGRYYLDVYENEEVVTKRVVAGANNGVNVVITEGLEEGELVVIPQTGGFTLGPGATSTTGTSIIPISVPGAGSR